ncbi:MAG: MBL fold metallo-hydrolase [Desulfarculaceae bacterium]|nr:MBL fold metallo-hydrolase [Desulfarculaceae bacterium]MCF8048748.1 MBL fold metallo-hydrolase [Desulfarculaceae bacterium]MCF8064892.1 MBL fold metallo-hydrolase [Desulfarculaceae bacterium]MCF8098854.1 MBL fold metallo-hydrolase [Desulfarculaceae bacterium]MCF8122886.1 MBL fold metallo-hydrolase [Desulfarculaceae bacterium]
MRLTCMGAARTVTGSSYLIEMDDDRCFLVDCGLFQGSSQLERRNWIDRPYRVPDLSAIFITHAHIDHSGLVPRLVRGGYSGPIFASKPTCELLKILWLDSAHIQEMEAEWQSRKNRRQGKNALDPLYEVADAEAAITLLRPIELECHEELLPGVRACFVNAGHILGAASLHLTLQGEDGVHRVGFSGDLGRPNQLIVPDPGKMDPVDTLFMETTYGGRTHKSLPASVDELLAVVKEAYEEGGKVLIPAFAVERTQEIIYILAAAHRRGELPDDMPVFLDSPLAINATRIFRDHPEYFDADTKEILANGDTPLNLPNLKFTTTTEESRNINRHMGPAIIIAGSGMANAGRIKHHLKHNLWRPNCHVIIVGFQAKNTTGRLLVEGAPKVKIFREEVAVRAKVHTINGFSAHADQNELLSWMEPLMRPGVKVNLIHGEEEQIVTFKALAHTRFPKVRFHIPRWNEVLELGARPVELAKVEPAELADEMRQLSSRLAQLAERLAVPEGGLTPEDATALLKTLKAANQAASLGEAS